MPAALLVLGAVLVTAGAAAAYWPLGLIVGGLFVFLLGIDLARTPTAEPAADRPRWTGLLEDEAA
jgi:hypothetical protein